jgi:hypothetical protein
MRITATSSSRHSHMQFSASSLPGWKLEHLVPKYSRDVAIAYDGKNKNINVIR